MDPSTIPAHAASPAAALDAAVAPEPATAATSTHRVPAEVRAGGAARDGGFRWRSREPSRLEGFSDAVFGFAVTLLVISLEVPRTFADLTRLMRDVPAFALSFLLLVMIWHAQYVYFRRYALDDRPTLVLNVALLFVVLVYVYPLRFLFSALVEMFAGVSSAGTAPVGRGDWPMLMAVYGAGFAVVFALFTLMYAHALRCRHALALDEQEVHRTRFSVKENALMTLFGAASTALGLAGLPGPAGWIYVLIGPAMFVLARLHWRGAALAAARAAP